MWTEALHRPAEIAIISLHYQNISVLKKPVPARFAHVGNKHRKRVPRLQSILFKPLLQESLITTRTKFTRLTLLAPSTTNTLKVKVVDPEGVASRDSTYLRHGIRIPKYYFIIKVRDCRSWYLLSFFKPEMSRLSYFGTALVETINISLD